MGKLKDLWTQLKSMDDDDPQRGDIQKEINKLEQYCINQKYAGFTSLTNWNSIKSKSNLYPWHSGSVFVDDIYMVGALNGKGLNYTNEMKIHMCDKC